jgi:GntR family transcriptional regulator/MocR family aminotransferase
MDPVFEFPIALPPRDSRGLLRALHAQLRAALLDGRLKPGLRLPSTRRVARAYGISRNTAVAAFDLLLSEGYLVTRRGSGAFVADALPQPARRRPQTADAANDRRLAAFWRKPSPAFGDAPDAPLRHDFRLGVPDVTQFPFDIWRRLSTRSLRALTRQRAAYAEPQGQPRLREAIARHVSFARAVACGPDDVIVTAGAQQAFDLLARILVTPGRTVVAVENPGYPPLRAAFAAAGARLAPVRVDAQGLVVEKVPRAARVVCVTPSHQFPLGSAMSAQRRAALLDVAQARGAVIVEDDYDGEFRFGGRPLDALQTLDRSQSVFYVGTFSKSLFPAIRLGYVVAPLWARSALVAAKQCADWHCGVVEQDTLAAFIGEGHLARHVRRMRGLYAARRDALLDALDRGFGRWLEPVPNIAGLHLAAFARPGIDLQAIVQRAREQSIGVSALRPYYVGPSRAGLAFGYGAIDAHDIVEGLARLRRAWPK